ncbi:HAD family hydrolase [Candidatus Beckwithbacteria bacterium]|nr:HAD family hydrolase [Candidatus Beckwithbacteria bacterium]
MHKPVFLFDIDKTLTNLNREVSPRTKTVLTKLQDQGFMLNVATGRKFQTIYDNILQLFKPDCLHITSGGGEIITTQGNIIWQKKLNPEALEQIYRLSRKFGAKLHFGFDNFYVADNDLLARFKKHNWKVELKPFSYQYYHDLTEVTVHGLNQELNLAFKSLSNITIKTMTAYDGTPYADITAKNVTKATTMKRWARLLNIDLKDVVAIGDSSNDIEMLKLAGQGIAMGNATEDVKAVADEIIGHTNNDGLAKYLEQFIKA